MKKLTLEVKNLDQVVNPFTGSLLVFKQDSSEIIKAFPIWERPFAKFPSYNYLKD